MKRTTISIIFATAISTTSLGVSAENTWKEGAKDAWIDGKAESALLFNTNLNSFDINTDVKDGVVILTGKVDSSVDKALAEELDNSIDGVETVDNKPTIVSEMDHELEVEDGVVTLSSILVSDQECDLAIAIAENTDGVSKVINEIELEEFVVKN
ncbi:BON domain-containing protein [uncultured Paraglaciecola sp.]|uniref:BON domain-containing protein n=1 Tax=uncultured Paraglaciecola sp. TaxID=1765024 RepID=UPI002593C57B|nr:BON domain-containing protein [uncultured Paraglaciecola sp.]